MLHAAPPLEVGGSRSAHNRCLLRDVGGHGALPADFSVYGEDAATTRFLLERILRGSGIAPLPSPASSSADFNPAERQDATEAPSGSPTTEQGRGEDIPEDSGTGAPTTADLHNPLEATAPAAVSRLTGILVPGARIIIVSNRLPVTAKRVGVDWKLDESSGGLVSALRGVTGLELMWVGWPGVSVPGKEDQAIVTHKLLHERCTPVFLSEDLMDQYYSGYCNNILWPVFHYMGLPQSQKFNMVKDFDSQLKAYEEANQMFADVVCKIHKEGDTVWIHDYHLMLLPMLLKKSNINMKVGWFLHTPFPSPEVYRALPNRMELLESVLNAELVGFQTYDYARNFVRACSSLLGLETYLEGVEFKGRIVKVEAFPIGIDSARFKNALELPEVQTKIAEFKQLFSGRKVLLGVDRFDMIKGLPQKVLAFEKFLEENEDLREKVVLLQIAVPTRSDVPEYQKLASQVHELVARVNGEFGTLKTMPIQHLDQTVDFSMLCALYAVTDVALVTSLRDGMNLVSYEYVACQESKKGVLILSEFAGAAQSLGAGAIIVNPWNITDVAKSIKCALEMPAHEREKRHRDNYELVSAHSAQDWAEDFILELLDTANKAPLQTKEPVALPLKETVAQFAQSRSRLLIFGFNETLTGQVQSFESATDQTANKLKLNPELKGYLKTLCDNEKTTVIVVSGYGKMVLDENFREFNMWLAAENGMFIRKSGEEWMVTTSDHLEIGCSDSVKKVIRNFTRRTPKSYLEQCEKSFVWNYKYADDDFGRNQAKEMLHQLGAYSSSNRSADIIQGRRTIEVRPVGVTKGSTFTGIFEELGCSKNVNTPIDYILCIGHFLAEDEDLYTLLNGAIKPESKRKAKGWQPDCLRVKDENYFSCTVGREHSVAQYKLEGTSDVVSLLHDLADTDVAH